MMLAKYFVIPFFAMIYASGWWAYGIWVYPLGKENTTHGVIVPLIILGIGWIILWVMSALIDFEDG